MQLPIRPVVMPSVLKGRTNGRLPGSILLTSPGQEGGPNVVLVEPAARAWRALEVAARAAGFVFQATSLYDSYRPYEVQERIFRERYTTTVLAGRPVKVWNGVRWYQRPGTATAAVPGTSNHGWGLAVDIREKRGSITTPAVQWLVDHAHWFGFSAELQSEPWHWRYVDGDKIPAAVLAFEQGAGIPAPAPAPDWRREIVKAMKVLDLSKVTNDSRTWVNGDDTKRLQGALLADGYGPKGLVDGTGRPDGKGGPATRKFLGEAQKKHKTGQPSSPATPDYIAGKGTWSALLGVK